MYNVCVNGYRNVSCLVNYMMHYLTLRRPSRLFPSREAKEIEGTRQYAYKAVADALEAPRKMLHVNNNDNDHYIHIYIYIYIHIHSYVVIMRASVYQCHDVIKHN